jgi:hypothetical protein
LKAHPMSLSSSTLAAIQKVGAAAFIADEKLRKEVKAYADRVHAAITKNAYSLGNDTLIENWKVAARLQQSLTGIEQELKKVYQVAADLTADDQPVVRDMPALAAPKAAAKNSAVKKAAAAPAQVKDLATKKAAKPAKPATAAPKVASKARVVSQPDLSPVDVVVKPKKKSVAAKVATPKAVTPKAPSFKAATPKAKPGKVKAVAAPAKPAALGANPTKLLAHFARTLNTNDFSVVNQTMTAQETGIPMGSMTAALKKLLETGRILSGPDGSLKLAASEAVSQPDSQPALQA